MIGRFKVRTDLAMENGEKFEKDQVEIPGVEIKKRYNRGRELWTTLVKIETEQGARLMEKPMGTYITMEAPNLAVPDDGYHREISEEISRCLKKCCQKIRIVPCWSWGLETVRSLRMPLVRWWWIIFASTAILSMNTARRRWERIM